LTGSSGRPGQIFFLNQNDVVLVKKQKSTGCKRVFGWVTPSFFFLYFFKLDPISAPHQLIGPGFKTTPRDKHMSRRARRANGQPK
jgi:hypothetical protein